MFNIRKTSIKTVVIIALYFISGCSSEKQRLPIQGEITFKGQPVTEGSIQFHPLVPTEGYLEGAMIEAGRYKILAQKGLLPGKYQVLVSAPDYKGKKPDPSSAPGAVYQSKELFPEIYNTKSTLNIEVTAQGPNNFDFHLK
ncbi:MAG: hypothetical protein CK551_03185 [Planctomycetaceae bacterium]|nr:MAG: hypothetical protein CK551_03185 [Planctomycetaceae bacterium]